MIRSIITAITLLFANTLQVDAGTVQTKPVICGTPEETYSTLATMNQTKIFEATQITTVKAPEGYAPDPTLLPMTIYMNLDDKTYTIVEYHPMYNQYCLISFGREGNFVND